ncbi:MAG: phosphoribosylamine--glycine ligase, partial [Candidatus Limnocylindria bacterium]
MEVLVLGSGAREHALAWRLARDEAVARVRIAPGNGGTPAVAETVPDLDPADPIEVARHAGRERYDLVVVGPEKPLAA